MINHWYKKGDYGITLFYSKKILKKFRFISMIDHWYEKGDYGIILFCPIGVYCNVHILGGPGEAVL